MIAICGTLPAMTGPDCVIEPATSTVIWDGIVDGGLELLPGSLFHEPPQTGGLVFVELAKPLKLLGAAPPLREFSLDHCAPQNVTFLPTTALRLPMTKLPL